MQLPLWHNATSLQSSWTMLPQMPCKSNPTPPTVIVGCDEFVREARSERCEHLSAWMGAEKENVLGFVVLEAFVTFLINPPWVFAT